MRSRATDFISTFAFALVLFTIFFMGFVFAICVTTGLRAIGLPDEPSFIAGLVFGGCGLVAAVAAMMGDSEHES